MKRNDYGYRYNPAHFTLNEANKISELVIQLQLDGELNLADQILAGLTNFESHENTQRLYEIYK